MIPKQTKLRSINVFDKIIHVASLPACQYANKNSSACFSMFSLEYKESERSSNRDIPNALKSSVWCGNIKGKTKRKLFKPETLETSPKNYLKTWKFHTKFKKRRISPREIRSLVASLFSQKETQEMTTRRIHGPYTYDYKLWLWFLQNMCDQNTISHIITILYHQQYN